MTDLHAKLGSEAATTGWSLLAAHFARGALLLCEEGLDVIDAGVALAKDDVQQVGQWMADGLLRKPSDAEATAWAEASPTFRFVIVQPFVVAETLPEG